MNQGRNQLLAGAVNFWGDTSHKKKEISRLSAHANMATQTTHVNINFSCTAITLNKFQCKYRQLF